MSVSHKYRKRSRRRKSNVTWNKNVIASKSTKKDDWMVGIYSRPPPAMRREDHAPAHSKAHGGLSNPSTSVGVTSLMDDPFSCCTDWSSMHFRKIVNQANIPVEWYCAKSYNCKRSIAQVQEGQLHSNGIQSVNFHASEKISTVTLEENMY